MPELITGVTKDASREEVILCDGDAMVLDGNVVGEDEGADAGHSRVCTAGA